MLSRISAEQLSELSLDRERARDTDLHDFQILNIFALRLDHFADDVVAGSLLGIGRRDGRARVRDKGVVRVVRRHEG